jgi:hypothetical protein
MVTTVQPLKPQTAPVAKLPRKDYSHLSVDIAGKKLDLKAAIKLRTKNLKENLPSQLQTEQKAFAFVDNGRHFAPLNNPHLDTAKPQELEDLITAQAVIDTILADDMASLTPAAELDDDTHLAHSQLHTYMVDMLEAEAKSAGRVLLPNAANNLATDLVQQLNVAELPAILIELKTQNQTKIDSLVTESLNPTSAAQPPAAVAPAVANGGSAGGAEPPIGDTADDKLDAEFSKSNIAHSKTAENLDVSEELKTTIKTPEGQGNLAGRKSMTNFKNNNQDITPAAAAEVTAQANKIIAKNVAQDITNRLSPTTQQSFEQVKQIIDQMICFENARGTTLTSDQQNAKDLRSEKIAKVVVLNSRKPVSSAVA